MRTQIIFSDEEWQSYKETFSVGRGMHVPHVAPSFPVLVISHVIKLNVWDNSMTAQHTFVEAGPLKKMLGL